SRGGSVRLPSRRGRRSSTGLSGAPAAVGQRSVGMIEAVMLWNEPNNKSHWDLELDPDWSKFSRMTRLAGEAIACAAPGLPRVLGGISPIDPAFVRNLAGQGGLEHLDVVAVRGFALDWHLWSLDDWLA